MKNFKGTITIKPDNPDKNTIMEIGSSIHHQLHGNKDYANDHIGINLSADSVMIWIDDCEGEIPDIVF